MDSFPEFTPQRGEERLAVLKRTLAKHGKTLPPESRALLEQEIRHQERLNKAAQERGL